MPVNILKKFQYDGEEILRRAALGLLERNLNLRAGERFLLVSDGRKAGLERQLERLCQERDVRFRHLALTEESQYEPPDVVRDALLAVDAALLATARSYTHSAAVKRARAQGARVATSPGVEEGQLATGLAGSYEEIAAEARRLADALAGAGEIVLTSPAGTDLRFSTTPGTAHAETGIYDRPGDVGNLPAGEASVGFAPQSAAGVLVLDGSYPGLGLLDVPVELVVEEGSVRRVEGRAAPYFEELWSRLGPGARVLAEFGLGCNGQLSLCGHSLVDEKVAGTAHVALGNDLNFGGINDLPYHADGTVLGAQVLLDGAPLRLPERSGVG